MHCSTVLFAFLSFCSLVVAAPAGPYDPRSLGDMVQFLEDQQNAGQVDFSRMLTISGDKNDVYPLMAQAMDIQKRFPNYKMMEDIMGSNAYLSMVKSKYMDGTAPRQELQEVLYKAFGVVVKGITVLGLDKAEPGAPFVDFTLPSINARIARGSDVLVESLPRGTTDLKLRKKVRLTIRSCRRDDCTAPDNTGPDAVDISSTVAAVEAKIQALPKVTVTLPDGTTVDDPTWPDDVVKADGAVADQYMAQWQAGQGDQAKPQLPKTNPTDPNAPTTPDTTTDPNAPTNPDAPTEPSTDPNAPTEPAANANDPTEPGTSSSTKQPPKNTPVKPPGAARRSIRFVA